MKQTRIFFSFLLILIASWACKEVNPGVVFTVPEKPLLDTTFIASIVPAAQLHDVLLFDVTGVRCNNCPQAAAIARKIADTTYPGRVTVVALYSKPTGPLWWPWEGYDTMANDDADAITQVLGAVPSLPTGCVDQILVSGNPYIQRSSWLFYVNSRLSFSNPANVDITTSWDNASNTGRLDAKVTFTKASANPHLVFIGILESEVIGKQSNQDTIGGVSYAYSHNHALRKLYSPPTGDTLKAALIPGRVFEKQYKIRPRYNWKSNHLDAVVWVVDAVTHEVIQAGHAKMKP